MPIILIHLFSLLSTWILKSGFLSNERISCLWTSTVLTVLLLKLSGKEPFWFSFLEK